MPTDSEHSALGRWILKKFFKIDIDDLASEQSALLSLLDDAQEYQKQLKDTLTANASKIYELQQQLKTSKSTLSATEKSRDRWKQGHNKLKSEHEAKLREIDALEGEKRSLQSLMSDLVDQTKALEATVKKKESELATANSMLGRLETDSAEKEKQIDSLKSDIERFLKLKEQLTSDNSKLEGKSDRLSRITLDLKQEVENSQQEIDRLKKEVSDRDQRIDGLEAQVEIYRNRLQDVINDKDQSKNEYNSRIKDLQEQIASLQAVSRTADENEEELTKEIKDLSQTLAACESALQEKTETLEDQKAEIKRLKVRLDALTKQHDDDIKKLQSLLRVKDNIIRQQADKIKELEAVLLAQEQRGQDSPIGVDIATNQPKPIQEKPDGPYYPLAKDVPSAEEAPYPSDLPPIVEDGSIETKRSIERVINCETGEHIDANEFFGRPKEEIAVMSRKLEIIAKSGDTPLLVCEKCNQPVRISKISRSKGESLFFAHCHRDVPCEWMAKNESSAKPAAVLDELEITTAVAEKSRYEQLRELIYDTLCAQQQRGYEIKEVAIKKRIKGEKSRLWRMFDVYVKWRNIDLVFKLQRYTDYLQDIVSIDEFCKQKKVFIIWVFGSDSATSYSYLLQNNYQSTLFDNGSCVFILDNEAERACIDKKELTLKCNWLIDGRHWYHTLEKNGSNGVLVSLNDLSFDNTETYKPYYQQMLITRSLGNESIELKPGIYKYCEGSLWGIYNKNKEIKSECKYSEIYLDEDANIVAVTADYLNKMKGHLSDEGIEIPSQRKRITTGVYLLTIFERYCLADKNNVPFTPMHKSIEEWCNDRLVILSDDGYGIIDYKGHIIAKPEYREFKIIDSRKAQVTDFSGTYKINYLGEIIPDETIDLPDGYRKVRHLDKWGIYNPEGLLIIKYLYQEIASFRKRFIGINENEVVKLNNAPRYDYRLPFRAKYKGLWKNGYLFECHGVEMKMLKNEKNNVDMVVGKEYKVYLTNAQLKGSQSVCAIAVADDQTSSKRFDHIDLDSDFAIGERLIGTITKKKNQKRLYIKFKDERQTYISSSRIIQSGLNSENYPVGTEIELEKIDFDPYYETTKWKVINNDQDSPENTMKGYNDLNSHERDARIHFDSASHTYTLNGTVFKSVTTIVDECFEQFDADYWARKKAPEMGMSPEEVKAKWEQVGEIARNLGTQMHEKIERFYLGLPNESDPTYNLFLQFTQQYHLTPYRTEWAIFDEDSKVAGTLDFLNYSDGVFTIFDWKRSNKIMINGRAEKESRWGKRAFKPITHVHDTTYWHYALQVSIYRYILEKNYGINVSTSKLAVFHPDYNCPYVIEVPYMRDEVIAVLNTRTGR